MIIHSTTLNTEAKVIEVYGGNSWIQHSGYVLRGATSGVTSNDAQKSGGSDDAVVVQHSHSVSTSGGNHRHQTQYSYDITLTTGSSLTPIPYGTTASGYYTAYSGNLSMSGTAANDTSWSNGTNANIPNYKSVYIWERIS